MGYPQPPYGMGQQPVIGGQQDPQSQYLQQALKTLGQTPQQGSPAGLGSNLMADALLQYGLKQRQGQMGLQNAYANPDSLANNPGAADAFAGLY